MFGCKHKKINTTKNFGIKTINPIFKPRKRLSKNTVIKSPVATGNYVRLELLFLNSIFIYLFVYSFIWVVPWEHNLAFLTRYRKKSFWLDIYWWWTIHLLPEPKKKKCQEDDSPWFTLRGSMSSNLTRCFVLLSVYHN